MVVSIIKLNCYRLSMDFVEIAGDTPNNTNVDISEFPNGLYIIKANGLTTSFVGKLVKN